MKFQAILWHSIHTDYLIDRIHMIDDLVNKNNIKN